MFENLKYVAGTKMIMFDGKPIYRVMRDGKMVYNFPDSLMVSYPEFAENIAMYPEVTPFVLKYINVFLANQNIFRFLATNKRFDTLEYFENNLDVLNFVEDYPNVFLYENRVLAQNLNFTSQNMSTYSNWIMKVRITDHELGNSAIGQAYDGYYGFFFFNVSGNESFIWNKISKKLVTLSQDFVYFKKTEDGIFYSVDGLSNWVKVCNIFNKTLTSLQTNNPNTSWGDNKIQGKFPFKLEMICLSV